mmetsp:Transcript_12673/g.19156  ORF Transcript_12673/g.19156 Transcript_12673/m.19156 type:complete len:331 (-) Transcript_12673:2-994(-)
MNISIENKFTLGKLKLHVVIYRGRTPSANQSEQWVLIHHGWTSSNPSHAKVAQKIAAHQDEKHTYSVITFDARGAGLSEKPNLDQVKEEQERWKYYSMEAYALDVISLWHNIRKQLKVDNKRFVYVGHSLGGMVGFEMCLSFPQYLEKAILLCPAPASGFQTPDSGNYFENGFQIFKKAKNGDQKALEMMINRSKSSYPYLKDQGDGWSSKVCHSDLTMQDIEDGVKRSLRTSLDHYRYSWLGMVRFDRLKDLHEIKTPILLVAGCCDSLLGSNLRDFRELRKVGQVAVLNAGHSPHREQFEDVMKVVLPFLKNGPLSFQTLSTKMMSKM